jgi:hypothetical protein
VHYICLTSNKESQGTPDQPRGHLNTSGGLGSPPLASALSPSVLRYSILITLV